MISTSEIGHAKNVSKLEELISSITSLGSAYNPSKKKLSITELQTLNSQGNEALKNVNDALGIYNTAVAARASAIAPLSKLIVRVMNSLKSTDASKQIIASADSYSKKIQGKRTSAKLTGEQKKSLAENGKEVKQKSSSQMSVDNRLDNFDKLINVLLNEKEYSPNETELKVASLKELHKSLKEKNTAVINALSALSKARSARNQLLYKEDTGLVAIANDVKLYVKSLFGSSDERYKKVSAIKFKAI